MSKNILIIEDDADIADVILFAIKKADMIGHWVQTGGAAFSLLANNSVDLVILDIGLPDINGFDWLKQLRLLHQSYANIPVLILTAQNEEIDKIVGLEIGADDYVTKPFSPRELIARIKTILKRTAPEVAEVSSAFFIDNIQQNISLDSHQLLLTRAEFLLLKLLLSHPNRVFSRQQLIEYIWSDTHPSSERTIDTHIKTLRAKLKSVAPEKNYILTHRGLGYALALS